MFPKRLNCDLHVSSPETPPPAWSWWTSPYQTGASPLPFLCDWLITSGAESGTSLIGCADCASTAFTSTCTRGNTHTHTHWHTHTHTHAHTRTRFTDEGWRGDALPPQHPLPHSTERAPLARREPPTASPRSGHAPSNLIGLWGSLAVCGRVLGPLLVQWGDDQVRSKGFIIIYFFLELLFKIL